MSLTVEQALQQAIAHHQSGQLQDAERLYRAILQAQPNHPDANHNLGVLAVQVKQPATGLPHFKAALEANLNQGQYWLSYIDALMQTGQIEAARQLLDQGKQRGLQGQAVDSLIGRLAQSAAQSSTKHQQVGNALAATPVLRHKTISHIGRKSRPQKTARKSGLDKEPGKQEVDGLIMLFNQKRYVEAERLARLMTDNFPRFGFGWKILGAVLKVQGRSTEALAPMRKAVALWPRDAESHNNLGNAFHDIGQLDEAEASYRRALKIDPDCADAHNNLGATFKSLGRFSEAEASYRQALKINPEFSESYSNLGAILKAQGRLDEAEASYRRAIQINPAIAEAHNNLGNILQERCLLDEAEASLRQALQIKPDYAEAHSNLGATLKDLGRLDEAEVSYRRALEINPAIAEVYSNLLFLFNNIVDKTPAFCLKEAVQYGLLVKSKIMSRFKEWSCVKRPERLRVGLVSGDFKNHAVGHFLEGLLIHVDRSAIELIAYPTNHHADELTARIKPCFAAWKPLIGQNDEAAARLIQNDGVHVLIDLSGHTCFNRLPLFAWKPAPVQVSWLGYFATTGVAEIDYLIADPWTLPGTEEAYFIEKIWRLPETRLCFTPPDVDVEVSPLPALTNGYITFGCFNDLAKMNEDVVALWARVLTFVPGSRLFLKARQLNDVSAQQNPIGRFAAHGINADRLILEGFETREKYLAAYHRVDIALDPFPYPGGTTSVEGLWMGVPVLTLAGERFLSRQGVGILMGAGLPEWIATDADDYVTRAMSHAADLQHLAALRKGLRQQVLASPIFDASRFAKHFEAALIGMWQEWCDGQTKI